MKGNSWERRESNSPWRPLQPLQLKRTFRKAGLLDEEGYTSFDSVSLTTEGSQLSNRLAMKPGGFIVLHTRPSPAMRELLPRVMRFVQ